MIKKRLFIIVFLIMSFALLLTACEKPSDEQNNETETVTYSGRTFYMGNVLEGAMEINLKEKKFSAEIKVFYENDPFYAYIMSAEGRFTKNDGAYSISFTGASIKQEYFGYVIDCLRQLSNPGL